MSLQPIPAGTTLIIRGGRAILPLADWHEPDTLDIAIARDEIAGIAPHFASLAGGLIEELDARGHLVLPGFINAHYHSHDVLAKGTLEEVPLETWSTRCRRNIHLVRWKRCAHALCSARWNACAPE